MIVTNNRRLQFEEKKSKDRLPFCNLKLMKFEENTFLEEKTGTFLATL
jgi:hypothetical protein